MKVLPVGTEITCPTCNRIMVRVIRELRTGDLIVAEAFESVEAQAIPHKPLKCPFDKTTFGGRFSRSSGFQLHTKDGWI
jgi:hypothetical protein